MLELALFLAPVLAPSVSAGLPDELPAAPHLDLAPAALHLTTVQPPAQPPPAEPAPSPLAAVATPGGLDPAPGQPAGFGAAGTNWLTFGAGVGDDFVDSTDSNIHGAWSTFVVDDVEFAAELAAWYHSQPGDDHLSINPSMIFRWHFIHTEHWTVYADAGIGVMLATGEVPQGGTSFNFTPRFGGGFTRQLTDGGTRLQVGVRWAHFSNARITGDDDNPGRDDAMIYAGIIIPF